MAANVVICLGNRFVPGDDLGSRVHARLMACRTDDIEVIDGGLCGLDLLRLVEGRRRVVFVDAVTGLGAAGEVVTLDGAQVAAYTGAYGHGAGLPYLLTMLPHACAAPLPAITLVGAEGIADEATVDALVTKSLEMARYGT